MKLFVRRPLLLLLILLPVLEVRAESTSAGAEKEAEEAGEEGEEAWVDIAFPELFLKNDLLQFIFHIFLGDESFRSKAAARSSGRRGCGEG